MFYRKHMLFAVLVALVASLLFPPATVGAAQAKKRYNILFLFADDMRQDTIGALGNKHVETPNLDNLVRRGTTFRNGYIMGSMSGAVCMPSRAMLMSGRTLFRVPMDLKGVPTLGQILRQAGYLTCGIGKWHNKGPSFLRSFEHSSAVMLGGMSNHFAVPVRRRKGNKLVPYNAKGTHSAKLYADAAIDFLKHQVTKRKKDQPFFLYVAFQTPHDPRDAPMKYRQMYYKKRPPVPPNFLPLHPFNLASDMFGRDEVLAPFPRTKEVIRDQLAEYYALITYTDLQIGRILQALRETGEYENTIIVFAADNGLALGSHGLLGKQSVYDHSVHVPLIFAGPGIPQDEQRDAFAYLFDIYPTLCQMNHVALPKGVEGKSLVPVIQGKAKSVRDSLYFNYKYNQRSVREGDWQLIVYPKINHMVLFDLKNDPHEKQNLADQPAQAKRIAHMKKLLRSWEKKIGAKQMPLTVSNPLPRQVNLIGRTRRPDRWQPEWIRKKYFGK